MSDTPWAAVDDYFIPLFVPPDEGLDGALASSVDAGLPPIQVSPTQGKMLHVFALMTGARTVLEIGTLGGYSTICLARALPPGGHLITLEIDPAHAAVARDNLARARVAERVEIRVGAALDLLPALAAEGAGPFDLIFIDADKENNAAYFGWALKLARRGTVIVVDNVVRNGAVADAASIDPDVQGSRAVVERIAAEPGVRATAIQTVGSKGYDGFAIAVVTGDV